MMDGKYSTNLGALRPVALFGRPSLTSFAYFHVPYFYTRSIHPTFPTDFNPTKIARNCYGVPLVQPVCCADAMAVCLCSALKLTFVIYRLTFVIDGNWATCYRGSLAGFPGSSASKNAGTITTALVRPVGHHCSNKEVLLASTSDMPDLSDSAQNPTVMASQVRKLDAAAKIGVKLFQFNLNIVSLDATKRPLFKIWQIRGRLAVSFSRKVVITLWTNHIMSPTNMQGLWLAMSNCTIISAPLLIVTKLQEQEEVRYV